jgi:hypothetical protein
MLSKTFQFVPKCSETFQNVHGRPESSQNVHGRPETFQNVQRSLKTLQNFAPACGAIATAPVYMESAIRIPQSAILCT